MWDVLRDRGTGVASIHPSCASGEGEEEGESSWGWTVRILWRKSCQCVFLGDGGAVSPSVVSQIRGPLEFQVEGLVPVFTRAGRMKQEGTDGGAGLPWVQELRCEQVRTHDRGSGTSP